MNLNYKQCNPYYTRTNVTGNRISPFLYVDVHGQECMAMNEVKAGSPVPNFRKRIASGQDASSNYTRQGWTKLSTREGRCETIWRISPSDIRYGSCRYRSWIGSVISSIPSDASLDNQALQRLKNKLASEAGNMTGLVPLGELREFGDLVKSLASHTTEFLPKLIGLRGVKDAWKHASDLWLTYSFGISPMVADVSQLGESLSKYINGVDHNFKQSAKSSTSTWVSGLKTDNETGPYGGKLVGAFEINHSLSYRYFAISRIKMQSSNPYGAIDYFGLGADILPLVGWELTTLSWVADYFVNVGDFLSDMFVSKSYTTPTVVKETKYVAKITGQKSGVSITPDASILANKPMTIDAEFQYFNRTVLSSLPRTPLVFKYQDNVASHAVNKLLNLTAVLASRVK